jgi:Mrp family chromosome partitioning ATPase
VLDQMLGVDPGHRAVRERQRLADIELAEVALAADPIELARLGLRIGAVHADQVGGQTGRVLGAERRELDAGDAQPVQLGARVGPLSGHYLDAVDLGQALREGVHQRVQRVRVLPVPAAEPVLSGHSQILPTGRE